MLSITAKESIKTGLAVTLTYAVALAMDWDKPMWAAFVAAFCSLATIGHSFAKLAERMLGTVLACAAAFVILALFVQDRWLFMLALSAWLGPCTYLAGGKRIPYTWQVAGFTCVIIAVDSSGDPAQAFTTAVLRTQETGLGILAYGLVALFLWPSSSRQRFHAAVSARAAAQRELFQACVTVLRTGAGRERLPELRTRALQQEAQFDQLLEAAALDTREVADRIRLWRRYQREAAELGEHLMRWQESFSELEALDLDCYIPELEAFEGEIERRLLAVEAMLGNRTHPREPAAVTLSLHGPAMRGLRQFEAAALAVGRVQIERIATQALAVFQVVAQLKGHDAGVAGSDAGPSPTRVGRASPFTLDRDRLAAAVRVLAGLWIAFLAVVYVGDVPGGFSLVIFAGALGVAMALTPQAPVQMLFAPSAWSVLFASVVYVFVLPSLTTFAQLGTLIFVVTTAICYLFSSPRQVLGRALGIAMFLAIASIENDQTYSFLVAANVAMMFALVLALLVLAAHVPHSPDPARAFLRLSRRYFRGCAGVVSGLASGGRRGPGLSRWRRSHHLYEVWTLPAKLGAWARFLDAAARSGASPEQVGAVVTGVQSVTARLRELLETSALAQAPRLAREFDTEIEAWWRELARVFVRLAEDPGAVEGEALRRTLDGSLERFEARIKEVVETVDRSALEPGDAERFYRLLGALRSLSEALVRYAGASAAIDWSRWGEERFV
jgi:uncharacterized membrane protein YccC